MHSPKSPIPPPPQGILRVKITCASDCIPCPECGEPFCENCGEHYADCACPGPDSAVDENWELVEIDGILYGEKPGPDFIPK